MGLVVVTGAGGYLGGIVAQTFAREYGAAAIRCIVRQRRQAEHLAAAGFDVLCGDLLDASLCRQAVAGASLVVHSAARLGSGPRAEFFEMNARVTRDLSRAALQEEVGRFVLISTIEAYGLFDGRTLTEDQEHIRNGHAYSESKFAGEQEVIQTFRPAGLENFCILRPGMVYGPNSPYWTQRYVRKAREGSIHVLGHGGRIFPVFESDVASAVVAAGTCDRAAGQAFNIVHDEGLTWWDWATAHHRLARRGVPRRRSVIATRARSALRDIRGRPNLRRKLEVELRHAVIPHDKAQRVLGWSPRPFSAGMALSMSAAGQTEAVAAGKPADCLPGQPSQRRN
ncbi:NAD-dependent epimerase/dehydratase family protein [Nocardia asiatica]|uniref:NAD-dependent epimerase/dehydratase family protein n=1 Tax=Nocardia asiatica TaxID=209252 RepID=UPI0002D74CA0|nr:NAD-dependent epimerase/dehydratase family protein [Nocardia asiatica]